jgi:hypothetical protein
MYPAMMRRALRDAFPSVRFSGVHLAVSILQPRGEVDPEWRAFEERIRRVRNGQHPTTHLPGHPKTCDALGRQGVRSLNIIRNPRDVVVSAAFYNHRSSNDPTTQRFAKPFVAHLTALIKGVPADDIGPAQGSIGERADAYCPWMIEASVLTGSFEDLVGPRGGDHLEETTAIRHIAEYLKLTVSVAEVEEIAS